MQESGTNELWALIGVFIGFGLSAGWEYLREKATHRTKRRAIEAELRTNLGLLPQKLDHLRNLQAALEHGAIVPGRNVPCATIIYDTYIGDVAYTINQRRRECLHVIYGSLDALDAFLDQVFTDFIQIRQSGQLAEPFKAYSSMCGELIERGRLTKTMIEEYLAGNPRKVTWD